MTPFSIQYPVKRSGSTMTTWAQSDGPMMFAVIVRRRLFRRPIVRVELYGAKVIDETALFERDDVNVAAHNAVAEEADRR